MAYEVTIGIPVYQAVNYIRATMESALSQTYESIEFLVVDDCGGDGSVDVVEQLQRNHPRGSAIRILHNKENSGVGFSRNRIISEASGKYLYFMDSDDQIEPDTIALLIEVAHQHHTDAVYASYEKIDTVNHAPIEMFQYKEQVFELEDAFATFVFNQYSRFQVSVCNSLFDIGFLRSNKLYFIDAMFWEDMAFTYDMAIKATRVVLLPRITYHYICRPYSLSNYQDRDILAREEILKNASTIDYLKWRCYKVRRKPYVSNYSYDLQMSSFYIVCHVLKQREKIVPAITASELRHMMRHPMGISQILQFRRKLMKNLVLWAFGKLPVPLFLPSIRLFGKIKKVL